MNKKKVRTIAITGMLMAITFVLGFTPLGMIPIPPVSITTIHIPVIIGAVCCGPQVGLVLGLMMGLISTWKSFGSTSILIAPLMAESPAYVVIMSIGARLMIPVVAYFIYKWINKKNGILASIISPICGTLTNTVCYLGLMLLFYIICGIDSATVVGVILGVGALNGSLECLASAIICSPIILAVNKIYKNKAVNK